jgi:hypothetical protein
LAVSEFTFAGQVVLSDTFLVVPALGIVGITYFGLVTLIVSASHAIEGRLSWCSAPVTLSGTSAPKRRSSPPPLPV